MTTSYRSADHGKGRERPLHLSFLVGSSGIAWCAQDAETGVPLAIELMTGNSGILHRDQPERPSSVSFITLPEWSALVPEAALVPGSEADHLALVHGGLPSGAMRDEPVPHIGARCIYVHDDESEHQVLQRWPAARPLPLHAVLLGAALARWQDAPLVLVHRGEGRLDITVTAQERVLLSNSFPVRAANDVLYFTLMAMERCGLKPSSVDLRYGGLQLTPTERDLLERHVQHCSPAVELTLPGRQGPDPAPERWLALLEQFACAS